MGFSEAVQWWDEWQLRILALGSLFLQYFLFIAAAFRKRQTPALFKFLTWLAYLGSDALAIYALATLFNRHKTQEWISTHRRSASLEALWAPVLLLHLGGQDGITAYNIEDNELWRRHVVTAVSQVTVAIYVFRKSWSGDKRLLQAAILFFVPGVLKCFEKPWALKSASINSVVKTSRSDETSGSIKSLDKYIKDARDYIRAGQFSKPPHHKVKDNPYKLFVDLAYPYSVRLKNLKYMLYKKYKAHRRLESGLSKTFDRFYTKEEVYKGSKICMDWKPWPPKSFFGWFLRTVIVYLTFPAIGLFHKSHREAYDDTDVKVTYTLLCCTAALEYIARQGKQYIDCFTLILGRPWPDQVAQYNLLGYFVRNKKLGKLRSLLVGKDYIDQLWGMKPCKSSGDITKLVHDHIKEGWEQCIKDITSYRAFNDFRGQWTLRREQCSKDMEWSLARPFDKSVLLWHLATDFCFYYKSSEPPENETARRCREMSNYMVYLLFVNPEMLMAGARSSLFRDAYGKLKGMMSKEKLQPDETEPTRKKTPLDEGKLAQKIIRQVKDTRGSRFVRDAWQLAEELMGLGEEKMWRVIKGVWVEMLCFSAGRCRGYLHAKSLGSGGEYLSYVWLLLSYMGMETLGERMQRTELPDEGDEGTADPTPATAGLVAGPTPATAGQTLATATTEYDIV